MYYHNYQIVTSEIPNEVSLGISIMGCSIRCPECHSKHLWTAENGTELTYTELIRIIEEQKYMTCILFMGGDWEEATLRVFLKRLRKKYEDKYKLALYSGDRYLNICLKKLDIYLDYLKVGPYIARLGGLTNPNTNQRLYKMECGRPVEDITYLFWRTQ